MECENSMQDAKDRILDAALVHVAFDGWSDATLKAAMHDSGLQPGLAHALFPRGGIDLAVAYHKRGDHGMAVAFAAAHTSELRLREKITMAVRLRLSEANPELVRRGTVLFGLPNHAIEGAGLMWGTADAIWNVVGDTSRDLNWYTKRATLTGVYGATVLYWLGDTSHGFADTWAFLDRRISDVMQIEKVKATVRANPFAKTLLKGPLKILERISAPQRVDDLPGHQAK
jgi:ubiquinone biosynthesis protein COQ9